MEEGKYTLTFYETETDEWLTSYAGVKSYVIRDRIIEILIEEGRHIVFSINPDHYYIFDTEEAETENPPEKEGFKVLQFTGKLQ